nr:molybdate ABC transporter substrate-binding protein [Thermobispora bispora]
MQVRRSAVRWIAGLLLPLALLAAAACGGGRDAGRGGGEIGAKLTVLAAASLTEPFSALGELFEREHDGVTVRFNFGASSTLAQQIAQGAPADVFAAASPETMRMSGAPSPTVFARNVPIIAVPKGNPANVRSARDLTRVKVALCAEQVPCGAATARALRAAGVTVAPVTLERDVKATLAKVALGEVDAGLVYRTDVKAAAGEVEGIEFPEAEEGATDYEIAVAPRPGDRRLAREFVDLVLSDRGRQVLRDAGFVVV